MKPNLDVSLARKLAKMSDAEIARLLRRSRSVGRRKPLRLRKSVTRWTPGEERLLGKWPDKEVAGFLGRTLKATQNRRLKLRMLRCPRNRRWTAEEQRFIDSSAAKGSVQAWARQTAERLGRSVLAIKIRRRLTHGPVRPKAPKWTRGELRLLGTRPDKVVAALIGRRCGTVQVKRCSLGIPSYRARHKFRWTPARDRLLGTASDEALARRFGTHRKQVETRRHALGIPGGAKRCWTAKEERLVGTMPDAEVARRIGRTPKAVAHRRRALGLAAQMS